MPPNPNQRKRSVALWRAAIEIAFILFLFYSNLLMGEFDRSTGRGKTLTWAIHDVITSHNLIIGMICAIAGYGVFELLRKKFL